MSKLRAIVVVYCVLNYSREDGTFLSTMYVSCVLLHCAVQVQLIQLVKSWSWNLAVVVH